MLVVINPGHYPGLDSGAVGSKTTEVERNNVIAAKVCEYLNAAGVRTVLIQENELADISGKANQTGADLFVSIHCNAASPAARGIETYYAAGSTNGHLAAEKIQAQLVSSIDSPDRGVKTETYHVLVRTNMPAVLVECAFISNEQDQELLLTMPDTFAAAIARGITDYELAVDFDNSSNENEPEAETGTMQSKYFSYDELACHHCGELTISPTLLGLLDEIRERVGAPVYISCAYRCPEHNAEVGGVRNSQHVLGTAADILVPEGWTVDQLANLAQELNADGVGRYYNSDFVHVDVREGRVGAGYSWNDQ